VRYSLTKQTLFRFVATALGFFSGVPQPCIRAEMSRMVDKEEQGIVTCQFALFNIFFKCAVSYWCQRAVSPLWQPNANLCDAKSLVFCIPNQHEQLVINLLFVTLFYYLYVQYFFLHCFMHTFIALLGALFAILASAESLCNFCSQLIFNPLYTWTINELERKFAAGITFFINAGILLIPMVLIG